MSRHSGQQLSEVTTPSAPSDDGDSSPASRKLIQHQPDSMVAAVRKQARALQQLVDGMPAGVMLLDSELRLLAWNRVYVRYFDPSVKWRVGVLLAEEIGPGEHSVTWDGRRSDGRIVTSGMYICRLTASDGMGKNVVSTRKMAYIR